jgi:Nickel responsive protein SCO4226-like
MTDVLLERQFDPPMTVQGVFDMARSGAACFGLYRVDWNESFLARDGRRMVCRFTAPDTESARMALRQVEADARVCWPGSIHDAPSAIPASQANVLVQRSFANPVELADIQAIEDAGARCLEMRNVEFVRTFFARDRTRMVCLYRAPDAESVRAAQREAKVPFDHVWAFQPIEPPRA